MGSASLLRSPRRSGSTPGRAPMSPPSATLCGGTGLPPPAMPLDPSSQTTSTVEKDEAHVDATAPTSEQGPKSPLTSPVPNLAAGNLFTMTCYNAVVNGFRTATSAGPLCDEPMQNVAFIIQEAQLAPWDSKFGEDPFGPISGQVISCLKEAYREAFLACAPRLVQPMYKVFIQASCGVLGRISAV